MERRRTKAETRARIAEDLDKALFDFDEEIDQLAKVEDRYPVEQPEQPLK